MAGGVGSRFWPLSRTIYPKQFLDILGTGKSLLRQTFERFLPFCPIENFYVVTSVEYVGIILEQIPELSSSNILAEPFRRNTAPCIAFANAYIRKRNSNANIVVTPADHLIINEIEFINTIKLSLAFVTTNDALLTLGIKPSRPETGYGYIQADQGVDRTEGVFKKVKTFTEKPSLEIAKVFLESGEFFWNSGIFIWSIKSIDSAFENSLPDIHALFKQIDSAINTQEEELSIRNAYIDCNNISIDYGIMERSTNVYMQTTNFGWSDLGTWSSLYDCLQKDVKHNSLISGKTLLYDSRRCIINIPPEKIAVIQGLNDYIIADSKDAILICSKKEEQLIKQFTNDIKDKFGDNVL
jgi:mannose-1-phosphate guanylyltransferase